MGRKRVILELSRGLLEAALISGSRVVRTYADIGKARRLLGYDPQVSVPEGVRLFWEWYRDAELSS